MTKKMKELNIQDVILNDLDKLLKAKSQHNGLNINDVVEIGAYVGASVLRQRFKSTQKINDKEINGVFGVIGNFYVQSFKNNFSQIEFDRMLKRSLELLQTPSFDQDCLVFFDKILGLTPNNK